MATNNGWQEISPSGLPSHDFKKEPELVGVLVDMQGDIGQYRSKLYIIEKRNGEKVKVWGCTVIDLRMQSAKIGDEIKIFYSGMSVNPKTKRTFKDFKVYKRNSKQTDDLTMTVEELEEVSANS